MERINGHAYPAFGEEEEIEIEEQDGLILMQRDAHFGGSFAAMLEYYAEEGIGVQPELDPGRIEELAQLEEELGEDLSPRLLSPEELKKVARAKQAYTALRNFYEGGSEEEQLLADLILTEEEMPEGILDALEKRGSSVVPLLIGVVRREEFYDPLFPGYGFAPCLAALALGRLGDPKAVVPLFEMLSREMLFEEGVVLEALEQLGDPAKEFLLKTLRGRPLTQDAVHAAFALSAFSVDPEVGEEALKQLEDGEVRTRPLLALYLVALAASLERADLRARFAELVKRPELSAEVRREMEQILKEWQ